MTATAPASTWGIPPATRKKVRAHILSLRTALEDDTRRQLAALGITTARVADAPASLSRDDRKARSVVEAIIGKAREAGDPIAEAVADYIRETAFTFLDRAVALRCLEERDLLIVDGLAESVIQRDPIRGVSSLVHRVRAEQRDLGPREVAREAFRRACAAVSTQVRVLFDPDAEHAQLFPLPATWDEVVKALNDPAIPAEAYREDEILGWVYQYWNAEEKDRVYAKLAKGGKIETPEELSAASCLYTERYIVDYLVQNTLGALWLEMHPPDSELAETWPYYVTPPEGNPKVEREPKRVREITLLDPACGSGHFLVRAFDVFVQLYAEEGVEDPAEVPSLILEHNLYGIDIDRRAVQIAALALYLKGCERAGPDFRPRKLNLAAADVVLPPSPPADLLARFDDPDLVEVAKSLWASLQGIREFGSLLHPERTIDEAFAKLRKRDRDGMWAKDEATWQKRRRELLTALARAFNAESDQPDLGRQLFGKEAAKGLDLVQLLSSRYDVVVTNPPYLKGSKLSVDLHSVLKRGGSFAQNDVSNSFISRSMQLLESGGSAGLVTQQAWLFLERYRMFRESVFGSADVVTLGHLGTGAFEEIGGEVVSVAAFVLSDHAGRERRPYVAIRASTASGAADKAAWLRAGTKLNGAHRHVGMTSSLRKLPGSPFVYWLPSPLAGLLSIGPFVGNVLDIPVGLQTFGDDQYVRFHWETFARIGKWVAYGKGGGFSRWHGLDYWDAYWPGCPAPTDAPGVLSNVDFLFRDGYVYSDFALGSLSVRVKDSGFVIGNHTPGLFVSDSGAIDSTAPALLNSCLATYLVRALSPASLQFRTGYVRRLPASLLSVSCRVLVDLAVGAKRDASSHDPLERAFGQANFERGDGLGSPGSGYAAMVASGAGAIERLVFDSHELGPEDVQAVLDETGTPAGWYPLISGYDLMPEAPEGIEIPDGLTDFLATLEHRELSTGGLTALKSRLKRLYQAGPGAKEAEPAAPKADDEEEGAVLGARIPIPTETFLEELSQKLEVHPISVHWLLEELRAEGVVSPPEEKREREDYVSVTILRMLGYRWPEQDTHEAEHGPILDADLVDADGIIPLVPCGDEPVMAERIRTRLERELGEQGAERFLTDFARYTKRPLADWLRRDFFKRHTQQFKSRPIAWHFRSPAGHFEAYLLYHHLSRETLARLRAHYAGGRIARLRAEHQRARERGATAEASNLQIAIEDVEVFRTRIEAIERGGELKDRIRCRWKDEPEKGRPGPYAPDIDDGVKVNVRPFQENGLLAATVIRKW